MKEDRKKKDARRELPVGLAEALQSGEPVQARYLAISRAGHDKGTLYVVLDWEEPYLWLADGRRKTLLSPKKKKRMHVQLIRHLPEELVGWMQEIRLDAHIEKILKQYKTLADSCQER